MKIKQYVLHDNIKFWTNIMQQSVKPNLNFKACMMK